MNPARLQMLRRLALQPMPATSSELLTKLRALDTLIREDGRIPVELVEDHLEQAMANEFTNYEGSRASSLASQIMAFLDRCREDARRVFPADDPDELAPPDYWHPEPPGDPWRDLDSGDTCGLRDQWRTRLVGPAGDLGWDAKAVPDYPPPDDDPDDDEAA